MTETGSTTKIVCNWLHLSDFATQDRGGKAVVVGIFDRIFAGRVPIVHAMSFLSFELDGPPLLNAKVRIQIQRPNSGNVMDATVDCTFDPVAGRASFMVGLPNLQLPDLGKYTIMITADGIIVKTAYFKVDPLPKGGD